MEVDFAADSTGFSTSVYECWFEHKWGRKVAKATWVKGHIFIGVVTHIVADATVTSGTDNDSPFLAEFVKTTAHHFTINEVSADKAYLSKNNLRAVEAIGATPYIPFKTNSVAFNRKQRRDPVWERAYHFYNLHRNEFLEHYHKRSNVECAVSMIKAKFGSRIRSKTPTAQVNEVLTKILCHNLVVLIQSMYELGIAPEFGLVTPEDDSRTLVVA